MSTIEYVFLNDLKVGDEIRCFSNERHPYVRNGGDIESLEVNKFYKVTSIEIHGFHTRLTFEGLNGWFNSVMFADEYIAEACYLRRIE